MSESLKGSPTAHRIPFDILCSIAQAGGLRLAVDLAITCRAMKRRIDERYEVTKQVDVEDIAEFWGERLPGVFGKYIRVLVHTVYDLRGIPRSVRELVLSGDLSMFKQLDLPSGLMDLTIWCHFGGRLSELFLPDSLQHLTIYGSPKEEGFDKSVSELKLPSNLQSLTFDWNFDGPMDRLHLPSSLVSLVFRGSRLLHFGPHQRLKLPPYLEVLDIFSESFDVIGDIPKSLKRVYCHTRNKLLHEKLRKLGFSSCARSHFHNNCCFQRS